MWAWDPQPTPVSCAELIALSRVRVTVCPDSTPQICDKQARRCLWTALESQTFFPVLGHRL